MPYENLNIRANEEEWYRFFFFKKAFKPVHVLPLQVLWKLLAQPFYEVALN